jgi:FG-GAP-like repeat
LQNGADHICFLQLDLYQVGSLPLFGAIGPEQGNPPGRLYFNDGSGHFTEDTAAIGIDLSSKYTSGLVQADFDGDGFTDIAVMTAPDSLGDVTAPVKILSYCAIRVTTITG